MNSLHYTGNNIVFIVGCPRSGTTWLQQLLASYPKAKTGPESYLFSWFIGPQLRAWWKEMKRAKNGKTKVGLGGYFKESEFLKNLREYMLVLMGPMIGNLEPDEIFVEKTPNHALYIPEIIEMLPDSKIVHILRDARDTVASLLAASKSRIGREWAPESARTAAVTWVDSINAVQKASKTVSRNQFYEIRYEKLLSSPEAELSSLSEFLSFDWSEQLIRDSILRNDSSRSREFGSATGIPIGGEFRVISGESVIHQEGFVRRAKVGTWKEELSMKQKIVVWQVAHRTMRDVGYEWKYPW